MRKELLTNPALLLARVAAEIEGWQRLRRLRGTCASWLGLGHLDSLELIELAARRGARVFYDVGAHVGSWTVLARALVPDSQVLAFEPYPEHWPEFRRRTAGFSNLQLFEVGLGSRSQKRSFHPSTVSDCSSFLPISELGQGAYGIANQASVELPERRLDELILEQRLPRPDLLKLDVQGFELEVLRGAGEWLREIPWVLCEASFQPFYRGQALFSEVAGFLNQAGLEVVAFGKTMRACEPLTQVDVLFGRPR